MRVGFLDAQGFEHVDENGRMSGWGYEYLQTLAYHTGWKYEYVYGTWGELIDKLESGEIDLMANISYTEERDETLLFSTNPQGSEKYYLYVKPDNTELCTGDAEAFRGKRIGEIPNVNQTTVGMQWLADEGIDVEYVDFETSRLLFDALDTGKVDAVLMNDTLSSSAASPIIYVGSSDYYFAVPKARADLMAQINQAMAEIQSANPRYNDEVKSRYSVNGGGSQYLTADERTWLGSHGNTIVLGYLDRALPYSTKARDGELYGSLSAFVDSLEETFGVQIEAKPYSLVTDLMAAMDAGEVDAIAPITNDFWTAEKYGTSQTDVFATTSQTLVYMGDTADDCLDVVACDKSSVLDIESLEAMRPETTVIGYDSMKECLAALRTGAVNGIIVPATALQAFRESYDFSNLKTAELSDNVSLSMCVKLGNSELLGILNKGIANARDVMDATALTHYSYSENELPIVQFFRRNIVAVLAAAVGVLATAFIALSVAFGRARKAEARAVASAAAKSQFLARMSHDIRTPLNGIIGLMEVGDLHPEDRERAAEIRAKTRTSANHLLALLSDVLEMGKIESDQVEIEHVPFNLMDVFRDVYSISSLRAAEWNVTLEHDDAKSLPYLDVYGSPVHLKRVFVNLLSNGIKYNKPGGSVRCTTRVVREGTSEVMYGFRFEDTGIGMSEDYLKHIFEPFSQASDDARSTYQGTGLGMSIVESLVNAMGGSISVESELGRGTVFDVVLPFEVDRRPEHGLEQGEAEAPSIAGVRILLVEDNELNREIANTLLVAAGAQVTCVENGKQAVEAFASKPSGTFEVILMDIMMPEMDGYEASRAIRLSGKRDAETVGIIATTANAFAEDAQRALEAGMNAHVPKPLDIDALKVAISKLV